MYQRRPLFISGGALMRMKLLPAGKLPIDPFRLSPFFGVHGLLDLTHPGLYLSPFSTSHSGQVMATGRSISSLR
jgi:hypothetical protein